MSSRKLQRRSEKQLKLFHQHIQRVCEQYQHIRQLKESLPKDEIGVQMDFAEHFSCRFLDEIQAAYLNQSMVTLHPVVAYDLLESVYGYPPSRRCIRPTGISLWLPSIQSLHTAYWNQSMVTLHPVVAYDLLESVYGYPLSSLYILQRER
ncbi:hypothetical protein CHS0354_040673 [Potamilus streckersoni]|uniref:Uncharacterized protein n=1 Tax=Potamilus streckersoni TaxID=2493646 RepID=A0AAE0WA62_9BIVA|nr:hypothetical protein CHS0354_040673 [Potamilus streckersoni]